MKTADVYEACPTYIKNRIVLRQTVRDDAEELLKCYSDVKAVPFFNSDNCHGDDFYYTTLEQMHRAMDLWEYSFNARRFIRWTILLNETGALIGTVECFGRNLESDECPIALLRIDLRSDYETGAIISDILEIANEWFYSVFQAEVILTKAIPAAVERCRALTGKGFLPLGRKLGIFDDYYIKPKV